MQAPVRSAKLDGMVALLRECVGEKKFQLAGLFAAGGEPRPVVAFHPDFRPAEVPAQPRELFDRREKVSEPDAGRGDYQSISSAVPFSGQNAFTAPATPSVTSVPMRVNQGQKTSAPKVRRYESFRMGMFGGQ